MGRCILAALALLAGMQGAAVAQTLPAQKETHEPQRNGADVPSRPWASVVPNRRPARMR